MQLERWSLPSPPDKAHSNNGYHVGLLSEPPDYHCAILAGMGFNYKVIEAQTGLTRGQISYRLKRAHVRARDYRNGISGAAQVVIKAASDRVARLMNAELRKIIDV